MKILVVDDHGYNRELLGYMLEDVGHAPVFAENGKQAIELVAGDELISLILMDVMMPIMDGLEATTKIKKLFPNRFLPVLFVTALENDDNLTACLNAGGDDFLPKPVNGSILIAKLNAHLRSKILYDNLKEANEKLTYHRQLMDREHTIVEHIYNNASARVSTYCENISIFTSPASMFNGDLVLVAPSPLGGVYGIVGDFTGHGLAASIGSLPVTEIFYQNVSRRSSVSEIAKDINCRLKSLLPSNMFFCAAIFEVGLKAESMTIWLGGMNDVLLISSDSRHLSRVTSAHMPIGILSDEEFDDSPLLINLNEYSRLYIYTDGITEAFNSEKVEFGQERLELALLENSIDTTQKVIDTVKQFSRGGEQSDDLSLLELKVNDIVHRCKETNNIVDVAIEYHKAQSMPWQLSIILRDEELKSTSVVDQIMDFVSSIKGIELHQDKIFIIVSELYNNSLEHGVLGLDSSLKSTADGFERYYNLRKERLSTIQDQSITVRFRFVKSNHNRLILEIEDSGKGFDLARLSESINDENTHGRGIRLLSELCEDLNYSKGGRMVSAVYELRQH